MPARAAVTPGTGDDLVALAAPIRRYLSARVDDPELAADVLQETLTRLWEARWRLERMSQLAYGLVTARNLLTSDRRASETAARHRHKLAAPSVEEGPEPSVILAEESAALRAALARLSLDDQRLLLEHEVAGVRTSELARRNGMKP